jgi:hypothetical protein
MFITDYQSDRWKINMKKIYVLGIIVLLLISQTAVYGASLFEKNSFDMRNCSNDLCSIEQTVYLFVMGEIYDELKQHLQVFVSDLTFDGYQPEIHQLSALQSKEDIRNMLIAGYEHDHLVGSILIGNVPYCMFESIEENNEYYLFMCDLYYMDLDGQWEDKDGNDVFDEHSGNIDPEIWVGRLWTPEKDGNSIEQLKNYFRKNHAYRTGKITLSKRALEFTYNTDHSTNQRIEEYLRMIYQEVIMVDLFTGNVSKENYINHLTEGYEFTFLTAHSTPCCHLFEDDPVYWYEIKDIDPNAFFYVLNCCGSARYVVPDYLVGHYVFSESFSLTAIGLTRTAGIGFPYEFADPLSKGSCIGDALKDTFINCYFSLEGFAEYYFYGIVIIGDPSIVITQPRGPPTENNEPQKPVITGNKNGSADTYQSFQFTSFDQNLDRMYYIVDWGDESPYYESHLIQSGDTLDVSHIWDKKGNYIIRAKVVDEYGAESDWGTLEVKMSKNKQFPLPLIERITERFPLLEHIINLYQYNIKGNPIIGG